MSRSEMISLKQETIDQLIDDIIVLSEIIDYLLYEKDCEPNDVSITVNEIMERWETAGLLP